MGNLPSLITQPVYLQKSLSKMYCCHLPFLHRHLVLYVAVRFCPGSEFAPIKCEGVSLAPSLSSLQKWLLGTQKALNSRGSRYILSPVNHLIFFSPTYHNCRDYLLQFLSSAGGPLQPWLSLFRHSFSWAQSLFSACPRVMGKVLNSQWSWCAWLELAAARHAKIQLTWWWVDVSTHFPEDGAARSEKPLWQMVAAGWCMENVV